MLVSSRETESIVACGYDTQYAQAHEDAIEYVVLMSRGSHVSSILLHAIVLVRLQDTPAYMSATLDTPFRSCLASVGL